MSNNGQKKTLEKLMQKTDSFIKDLDLKSGLSEAEAKDFDRMGDKWWVIFGEVCREAVTKGGQDDG